MKNPFNQVKGSGIAIFAIIVFGATILGSAYLISSTNFYIRDSSTAVSNEGEVLNTISVSGDGKVYAIPDIVVMSVTVSEVEDTSEEALAKVNEKVNEIKEILKDNKDNKVDDKDMKTANFSIRPEYEWRNNTSKLVGQEASQTIEITMRDIADDKERVTTIIDEVVQVKNVRMDWIQFDLEDKTEQFQMARKLAYKKAEQKGIELADLGGLDLLAPVSITDVSVDYSSNRISQSNTAYMEAMDGYSSSSDISTGQLEISVRLSVNFGFVEK